MPVSLHTGEPPGLITEPERVPHAEIPLPSTNIARLLTVLGSVLARLDGLVNEKNASIVARFLRSKGETANLVIAGDCFDTGKQEDVYNLEVDGVHEYFANGILVANCMDAMRYGVIMQDELTSHGQYAYDSVKPRFRLVGY
jgi:hypothetical protein